MLLENCSPTSDAAGPVMLWPVCFATVDSVLCFSLGMFPAESATGDQSHANPE